jgi:hypothetical protein
MCVNHTRACRNHTHTCQNNTLRVNINLVRVEITVVSVVITFLRFNITLRVKITCLNQTMRVEITLCVWKLHSVCRWHTLRVDVTLYVYISHSCVLKSHIAFRNYTRACVHHSMYIITPHYPHPTLINLHLARPESIKQWLVTPSILKFWKKSLLQYFFRAYFWKKNCSIEFINPVCPSVRPSFKLRSSNFGF